MRTRGKTIFSIEIRDLFCPSFLNPAFSRLLSSYNKSFLLRFIPTILFMCHTKHIAKHLLIDQSGSMRVVWDIRFSLRIRKNRRTFFCLRYKQIFISIFLKRCSLSLSLVCVACIDKVVHSPFTATLAH